MSSNRSSEAASEKGNKKDASALGFANEAEGSISSNQKGGNATLGI